ncbi:lysophospholipid acyltransferase family protein [Halobacillus litoralis]|uniref:lysophospholipid acyltransferase family protein n=1 Tax=Halobacillus litoralis TaxID=45668 RepID=UPI001CFC6E26|nr:lysophospholipid acyltransferase family protein [Halobacillus litoralis]WLR47138.1 lysophospholipid acyltransferase family protein [Halobacillus litoralis]
MFQPARKTSWIEWGFTRFNRLFLNYHFNNILIQPPSSVPDEKTLFLINHSTWWDPLFIFYINDRLVKSDGYGMMHEEGIRRFPFFRRIGAYSVNGDDRRHLVQSLHYSKRLLEEDKTVWIFPQGNEQPLEKRPLEFFSGISYLTQRCPDIKVVPVSLYYALEHTKKPNAYIRLGDALPPLEYEGLSRKEMTRYFEESATKQLDQLRQDVIEENLQSFKKL